MQVFTKSKLIGIATLALVCIPTAAVSATNIKPSQLSQYSTSEIIKPKTAALANETNIARRVESGHGDDIQNACINSDTTSNSVFLLSAGRSFTDRVADFFDLGRL